MTFAFVWIAVTLAHALTALLMSCITRLLLRW